MIRLWDKQGVVQFIDKTIDLPVGDCASKTCGQPGGSVEDLRRAKR
jgi:hypothetical protein